MKNFNLSIRRSYCAMMYGWLHFLMTLITSVAVCGLYIYIKKMNKRKRGQQEDKRIQYIRWYTPKMHPQRRQGRYSNWELLAWNVENHSLRHLFLQLETSFSFRGFLYEAFYMAHAEFAAKHPTNLMPCGSRTSVCNRNPPIHMIHKIKYELARAHTFNKINRSNYEITYKRHVECIEVPHFLVSVQIVQNQLPTPWFRDTQLILHFFAVCGKRARLKKRVRSFFSSSERSSSSSSSSSKWAKIVLNLNIGNFEHKFCMAHPEVPPLFAIPSFFDHCTAEHRTNILVGFGSDKCYPWGSIIFE